MYKRQVFIDLESGRVRGYNCDYADLEEIAENFSSLLLDLVEQALELGNPVSYTHLPPSSGIRRHGLVQ